MNKLAQDFIGTVTPPDSIVSLGSADTAFGRLLGLASDLLLAAGGIYALFNLILAGYTFMSAGDDPKKIQSAWAKIYQTLIGLAFLAGSFTLAAIFGQLIFGDWSALLAPTLPTL